VSENTDGWISGLETTLGFMQSQLQAQPLIYPDPILVLKHLKAL
jgi:hypothetical protein